MGINRVDQMYFVGHCMYQQQNYAKYIQFDCGKQCTNNMSSNILFGFAFKWKSECHTLAIVMK